MQIEVSATRVIDMLAIKLGKAHADIARLEATNEVLIERLRAYDERDRNQRSTPNGHALSEISDDSQTPLPLG